MNLATQKNKYFLKAADIKKDENQPEQWGDSTCTPIIDGKNYYGEIKTLLNNLIGFGPVNKQFFYIVGWWNQLADTGIGPTKIANKALKGAATSPHTKPGSGYPAFRLQDNSSGPHPKLLDLLAEKAEKGVDVKVISWVNHYLLLDTVARQAGSVWRMMESNIKGTDALRSKVVKGKKPMKKRAILANLGHAMGSIHCKMVIAFDGTNYTAFAGGIDFAPGRASSSNHPGGGSWHDLEVKIEGRSVFPILDNFIKIWNEQVKRTPNSFALNGKTVLSHEFNTKKIPTLPSLPLPSKGNNAVQVGFTFPRFKGLAANTPPSFAKKGWFGVKPAWRKAIENASQYIYIEDQGFYSHEVMKWINGRIKAHAGVKVILLTSGKADPTDPPGLDAFMKEAINKHLLSGLTAAQKKRIGVFARNYTTIHSKVMIIDDHFAAIGSANIMRRSLYTDFEVNVSFLDPADTQAKKLRVDLWAEHFGKTGANKNVLNNLTKALSVWKASWGAPRPYVLPATRVHTFALPITPAGVFSVKAWNRQDWDSRQALALNEI